MTRKLPSKIALELAEYWQMTPHRHFLWLPIVLGLGMAAYFSLPTEPAWGYCLGLFMIPAGWHLSQRRWPQYHWLFMALTIMSIGFVWAKISTERVHQTILAKDTGIRDLTGRLVEINDVEGGYRLLLDQVSVEKLPKDKTPSQVRIKLRGKALDAITGDYISVRAGLLPPSGPVMPGGFDFARYFYFQGIGAVGYALPPVTVLESKGVSGVHASLTKARQRLSAHIRADMSEDAGGIAAALMTGDRAVVTKHAAEVMRAANLSHVLAISGMHMAIICGLTYMAIRRLLVLLPFTRYLTHTKKIAALAALSIGACYLLIAGIPLSAARAYVMVAVLLGAVLLDREASPMRSLAWAALLLLLYDPSNLLEPGFQLSFAATMALIAFYEATRNQWLAQADAPPWKRPLIYLAGILLTTLVAEFATAPLVLYHFNTLSIYGMLANLLVMPIVSFVIMPSIIFAYLCMPLALDAWALIICEWGIDQMLFIAETVTALPHSEIYLPSMPALGFAFVLAGGCWLCIWQGRLRWIGLGVILLAQLSYLWISHPDLFISADGKQIATRINGELVMVKGRRTAFTANQWTEGSGYQQIEYLPKDDVSSYRCDALGCVLTLKGKIIAFPSYREALSKDCSRADMIIAAFNIRKPPCRKKVQWIGRKQLTHSGSRWFWIDETFKSSSSAQAQGVRPWRAYPN
ncbi:MAG: ComEC family competence protein [Rickettsiales bacterium]|nr:ComEC family competence protein [Rickettsiales bacterium]